ncbi:MAG: hypothetical protein RIT25_900 [Planctomycetota bacterium]
MSGTVELDKDGFSLVVRFPYREDLVAAVKSLPQRRWDPKDKAWRVPRTDIDGLYKLLSRHLFDFAPEVMSLLAGTLGSAPKAPAAATAGASSVAEPAPKRKLALVTEPADTADAPVAAQDPAALTISTFNETVREVLRGNFMQPVWLVGEVMDFDKSAGRKHRYFKLVEKDATSSQQKASVSAVLFEQVANRLLPRLAKDNESFTLRDGIEIRVKVKVDFYPATGSFQVIVEDIDPSFTLGKLALSREQILKELRQLGIATRNRELAMPVPAIRIGVLTSKESDGWNDFRRTLEESRIGFEVTIVPVKVQGMELKPTMLAGLQWFAQRADDFDVLCIVRGGGSRTDLAWFDDREVALAVARHPLKVLIGIGHERDYSVLDEIAHREKTPTAVAGRLVVLVEEARATMDDAVRRLKDEAAAILDRQRSFLRESGMDLRRVLGATMKQQQEWLRSMARAVAHGARRRVLQARSDQAHLVRHLVRQVTGRVRMADSDLSNSALRLQHGSSRLLERAAARLEQQQAKQRLLDPVTVLQRGFALVRGPDGRVVPAATRIAPGAELTLQLRDGRVRARAEHVDIEPRTP